MWLGSILLQLDMCAVVFFAFYFLVKRELLMEWRRLVELANGCDVGEAVQSFRGHQRWELL
jgi:hypothetical protein